MVDGADPLFVRASCSAISFSLAGLALWWSFQAWSFGAADDLFGRVSRESWLQAPFLATGVRSSASITCAENAQAPPRCSQR